MRYAIWNNKGGVGKSFLSFIVGTEIAHRCANDHVVLVDMCPQANLSEVVLGGNGKGSENLATLLARIIQEGSVFGREARASVC